MQNWSKGESLVDQYLKVASKQGVKIPCTYVQGVSKKLLTEFRGLRYIPSPPRSHLYRALNDPVTRHIFWVVSYQDLAGSNVVFIAKFGPTAPNFGI